MRLETVINKVIGCKKKKKACILWFYSFSGKNVLKFAYSVQFLLSLCDLKKLVFCFYFAAYIFLT